MKNPPAMMWVGSLGWEDLLQKKIATHSSILAWEIRWTEEPTRLQCMGLQELNMTLATKPLKLHNTFTFLQVGVGV